MKVKESTQTAWSLGLTRRILRTGSGRILGAVLYSLLILAAGVYIHRAGVLAQAKYLATENVDLASKWVRGWLSRPEHITIDIRHEDFMRLAQKRQTALASGVLVASPDDYVPAQIRYKDQTIDVRLRLKGDLSDHWEGDKWSFRVVVKGDRTLFGMKQFSIQHPQTRAFIYEWFYHRALAREGVLALRYDFIDVTVNGKDMGVYALEEHFEKRLVEHNERREGPIVRFNEDLMWDTISKQTYLPVYDRKPVTGSDSYLSSDVDTFQTGAWSLDPVMRRQQHAAIQTLESFRRGSLRTSEAFDVEKLARFFALSDILGAVHGTWNWTNARFYHNPVTGRLEPIAFDAYHDQPAWIQSLTPTQEFISQTTDDSLYVTTLFADREFFEQYVRELERMSEPSYLDDLFAELNGEIERNQSIIHKEFPRFEFSRDVFYANQQRVRIALNPGKGLHAYYHQASDGYIELKLGEIQYLPVEVIDVTYGDSSHLRADAKVVLPEKSLFQPIDYRTVRFALPENLVWSEDMLPDLRINYRILGTSRTRSEPIFPWTYLADDFVENRFLGQESTIHMHEFLVIDEATKRIFIKPGAWELDQSLIVPQGYRVLAAEGTRLNLSNSAKILSFSPLEFVGSADDPIVVQSKDSTGQGIVVMNVQQTSAFEHVVFENLTNPSQGGWELTGAVTFYEAPVRITDCQFVGIRSEDALNVIRSEFSIDKTLFSQTRFDAFDADFANGEITNTSFVGCGNDAVDVSGSVILIQHVSIDGAGDKGLSAGENSQMTARDVEIRNAAIAVASKDLTKVAIENMVISGGEIGLAVYQKKPEFGPASLEAQGLDIQTAEIPYLVEVGSTVVVDGAVIEDSRENVKDILYGVEYGQASQ